MFSNHVISKESQPSKNRDVWASMLKTRTNEDLSFHRMPRCRGMLMFDTVIDSVFETMFDKMERLESRAWWAVWCKKESFERQRWSQHVRRDLTLLEIKSLFGKGVRSIQTCLPRHAQVNSFASVIHSKSQDRLYISSSNPVLTSASICEDLAQNWQAELPWYPDPGDRFPETWSSGSSHISTCSMTDDQLWHIQER